MSRDDVQQTIFGGLDGLSSAIGMIAALAIERASTILVAATALAVGSAVSMAAGKYLSDPDLSLRRAIIMAAATLTGALAPALPFAVLAGMSADIACALIAVACAAAIAELRLGKRVRSYPLTFGILTLAAASAVGASLAAGGAA